MGRIRSRADDVAPPCDDLTSAHGEEVLSNLFRESTKMPHCAWYWMPSKHHRTHRADSRQRERCADGKVYPVTGKGLEKAKIRRFFDLVPFDGT